MLPPFIPALAAAVAFLEPRFAGLRVAFFLAPPALAVEAFLVVLRAVPLFFAVVDFLAAGFLAVVFLAVDFLAAVLRAGAFFAGALAAVAFLAAGFFAVVFLTPVAFFAVDLRAVLFFAVDFAAVAFFAAGLRAVVFLAVVAFLAVDFLAVAFFAAGLAAAEVVFFFAVVRLAARFGDFLAAFAGPPIDSFITADAVVDFFLAAFRFLGRLAAIVECSSLLLWGTEHVRNAYGFAGASPRGLCDFLCHHFHCESSFFLSLITPHMKYIILYARKLQ